MLYFYFVFIQASPPLSLPKATHPVSPSKAGSSIEKLQVTGSGNFVKSLFAYKDEYLNEVAGINRFDKSNQFDVITEYHKEVVEHQRNY